MAYLNNRAKSLLKNYIIPIGVVIKIYIQYIFCKKIREKVSNYSKYKIKAYKPNQTKSVMLW